MVQVSVVVVMNWWYCYDISTPIEHTISPLSEVSPSLSLSITFSFPFLRVAPFIPFLLQSVSTLFPNLFRFVRSYRIWNWLVKRRQVFTEEFCHSGLISFYLPLGLSVCLHVKDMSWVCMCVCELLCVSATQPAVHMSHNLTFYTWLYLTYA